MADIRREPPGPGLPAITVPIHKRLAGPLGAVLLLCLLGTIMWSPSAGAEEGPPGSPASDETVPPGRTLVVSVREVAPFAMEKDGDWSGYSVDLWEEVARKAGIEFTYQRAGSVNDQLDAVRAGTAGAALGAISITADRAKLVDFSQPTYDSGIGILASDGVENVGLVDILGSVFTRTLAWLLGFFVLMVFVVGHVVWLAERKRNSDHFPDRYIPGVAQGMWWAVVTMTTVGYGDTVARTRAGRIVAVAWMLVGLVLIAQFTASVTSALTVEKFDGAVKSIGDLYGREVLTVEDTTSASYLDSIDLPAGGVADIDIAVAELLDGRADAVVYDEPVLAYEARTTANGRAHMVPKVYQPQSIGMAFADGDPNLESVDDALLVLREDGTMAALRERWFGSGD